jgi:hypothetical protein
MPERSPDRPPPAAARDDGTRDIRLPPLPDREAPAVPPEWSSYLPTAGVPEVDAPTPDGPAPEPEAPSDAPRRSVDEPTDRLASSNERGRNNTLAFTPPPSVQLLKVSVTPTRRRTSRVLWTLFFLIVAVIVASGIYLVVTVVHR